METVVVTGSRIAVSSAFDAPTPVSVINAQDIQMTGTLNIESLLNQSPQFTGATNGSPSSNTQQANGNSGAAYANLRNLNSMSNTPRTLVLVNGRRFTISGTSLMTDLNTIPTALIERTEIVTGGSSAVYGSDAIAGVINFIMKKEFSGAQVDAHVKFDSVTNTPEYSFDATVGGSFDHDRGNVAVSMDYLNRGGIHQYQIGYASVPINEACVTAASYNPHGVGVSNGSTAANCASSGGRMGFTQGGSSNTYAGNFFTLVNGSADATLASLFAAAGITGGTSTGFTFDSNGAARNFSSPADLFNTTGQNYMLIPQERWMINSFAHYDIAPWLTAYAEMHFSDNTVDVELTPSNIGTNVLINTNNPYLSSAMRAVLVRLDQLETGTTNITEGSKVFSTTPNDNLAILNMNKRFAEIGNRHDQDNRVAWRFVGGFRGDIGSPFGDEYLKDLSYDVYYDYARTIDTNWLNGLGSRSAIQNAILSQNGAAPVCDLFGPGTMTSACVAKVSITDSYTTKAEQAGAVASLTGTAIDLPAGPLQFDVGLEWRFDSAQYIPDPYLASGEPTGFNYSYPTKGQVSVKEIFGELRVPVLKDLPLVKSFTANGAFRNSCYDMSGVGCVWTYSAGGDWKVLDDIAFRGQYQHAIRAPNVGELFSGSAANFVGAIDPCGGAYTGTHSAALQALCVATGVPASMVWSNLVQDGTASTHLVGTTTAGNPDLDAEKSDTLTFGVVMTPTFIPGLQASIDWYSIYIKNAVGTYGGSVPNVLANCYTGTNTDPNSADCSRIFRDSTGVINAPYYVNLGYVNNTFMKVQGLDLNANYEFDPGFALLSSDSTFTISTQWSVGTASRFSATAKSCLGLFGATCREPSPKWKGVTNIYWHDGPLTVDLRWRLIDSVTDDRFKLNGTPLNQMALGVIPTYHYFDLSASYDINENLTFSAGINNVFAIKPPLLKNESSAGYGYTWPATYDAFGQTLFFNLTAKTD